jgi:hypothetical protein
MNQTTRAIAVEAARLLTSQAEADLASACRKAAKRLGIGNRRLWPDAAQLEQALREQQALFAAGRQSDALARLRLSALELMELLQPFSPLLTGSLLSGLADTYSPIELHLFSERCEDIALYLQDRGLHPRPGQQRFRYPDGSQQLRPQWRLQTPEELALLSCFPLAERHGRAPLDNLGSGQLRRINRDALARLVAEG